MFLIPAAIGVLLIVVAVVLERRPGKLPDRADSGLWKGALLLAVLALLVACVQGFRA